MRPPILRALVFDLYARVTDGNELADKALHRTLRAHPELHSRERRHVAESLFAMVRMVRRFDHQLDAALRGTKHGGLANLATPEVNRFRYAAAMIAELGLPVIDAMNHAGIDSRFTAALQRLEGAEWPQDPVRRLALERSLPDWFATRLYSEYGDKADALAAALDARAPLSLRANALKGSREQLVEALAAEKIKGTPGTLSPWSVTLEGHANVFGLKAYKAGLFEVQDEGSQLIALAADARPGQLVVDACAGGGGKTLALAATMKNKGRILACDVTDARLADIPERARRAGAFLIDRLAVPEGPEGEGAIQKHVGRADVVLVDAPCSGTGSWRRHADARWKLTEAEADAFPAKQRGILDRYAKLVKNGGTLVYATCSVLGAENEAVVEGFLAAHPEFKAMPIEAAPAAAIDAKGHLRVAPHTHGTDGFFAAAMRRVK